MSYLPATYTPTWNYGQPAQQVIPNYQQLSGNMQAQGLTWVDGEVGAKAFQMPAGWPANTPIALWDTNDTVIYLKSTNQMGMPNPLQKAYYQLEERTPKHMSGAAGREDYTEQSWDEERQNKFASKQELNELKEEIEKLKRGDKE